MTDRDQAASELAESIGKRLYGDAAWLQDKEIADISDIIAEAFREREEATRPRAEVEASEETSDTEANGYPLTEARLELDDWKRKAEIERENCAKLARSWKVTLDELDAAEAERDTLREENKALKALAFEADTLGTMHTGKANEWFAQVAKVTSMAALLRAEKPKMPPAVPGAYHPPIEPAPKPEARTCETEMREAIQEAADLYHPYEWESGIISIPLHTFGRLLNSAGIKPRQPRLAASDGKGE